MTTEEILNKAGEMAVRSIQESFDTKNLNDTERARNSINYQVTGNTLIITGVARVLFLEFGRRAGTMPPIDPIQDWVERKLNVSADESRGVAFAIAKKIKEKGTDILTDRAKGLQLELTISQLSKYVLKNITKSLSLEITGGLAALWETGNELKILE